MRENELFTAVLAVCTTLFYVVSSHTCDRPYQSREAGKAGIYDA